MDQTFSEMIVKAKPTDGIFVMRSICMVLCLLGFLMCFLIPIIGIISVIVFGFLTYKVIKWTSLEYEYSLFEGKLDIDAIMGQKRRKNKASVDLNSCMMVAKETSSKLDAVRNPMYKIKDYSRGFRNGKRYEVVIAFGDLKQRILFEPDEKMIQIIKTVIPSKFYED